MACFPPRFRSKKEEKGEAAKSSEESGYKADLDVKGRLKGINKNTFMCTCAWMTSLIEVAEKKTKVDFESR